MIGVFDSGLGGLTILKEFLKVLPQYDYMYLGDSARTPYGNKSQELIYNYTKEAVDFLFKKGCQLVIIACNTASAKALKKIQQEWLKEYYPDRRVLGVIIPVVEEVLKIIKSAPRINCIGVIGTRSTIESGVYNKEISKHCKKFNIYGQACPLLVSLIEEGWIKKRETSLILKSYLRPLKQKRIKILILGCTHYPILLKPIREIMGQQCQVLNSPEFVAKKLDNYLKRHSEIEKNIPKNKKIIYYTTDEAKRFKLLGEKFLKRKIKKVEKINLRSIN